MPASKKPCRSDKPSIKDRWSPTEGAFFEVGELVPEEYAPSFLPGKNRKRRTKFEAKQPEILSTAELISSLNQIWDSASNLAIFKQQTILDRKNCLSQNEDILVNLGREENGMGSISADSKYFCVKLGTASQPSPVRKPNFEFVKVTKKISMFDSCNENINNSIYQGILRCGTDSSNESWKRKGLAAVGFSYEFGNVYKWMREMIPAGLQYYANAPEAENKKSGLTGLYRGIASNIASSAPISALYTFTYESVKGALLPLFPKEYHSLAHCMAGGCASVATSFIFTPSERIKQQMQVGVHYENCWNALVGILKKGGLPSLYTGWGAVLCRNVPHSIIKFYTYETLKRVMLTSMQSSAQPNTLQTLVCGALAGSTAALFTTPFDVVKTRLQTQVYNRYVLFIWAPALVSLQNLGKFS
ncbi:Mitochondrial substrate/solute carrier [Corchorus olitorius]|uniref:Mitochondrial substrate/solute carrier n=1 Tax=Corchorus olitorius TaxID=93759 RepID=A0A1R3GKM4_9ROSI|nr:Mitochondrial substrate/solute carrier [Corchorus olitorius]